MVFNFEKAPRLSEGKAELTREDFEALFFDDLTLTKKITGSLIADYYFVDEVETQFGRICLFFGNVVHENGFDDFFLELLVVGNRLQMFLALVLDKQLLDGLDSLEDIFIKYLMDLAYEHQIVIVPADFGGIRQLVHEVG